MAKLRKGVAYRNIERPYTRKSKFRSKNFIAASPHLKIVHFDMGNKKKKFQYTVQLISKNDLQIRHNALESARLSSNRLLEKELGKAGFRLRIKVYPHHILRENPLAAGAGADRMSTGMKKSFGKPIGAAAQVRKGQTIMEVFVDKESLRAARLALSRALHKLPCSGTITTVQNS